MPIEPIRSILIANRSEIAIRVMRAAAEMRIRTVAIYSQQDRQALHRFKADESYLVGEGQKPLAAYLDGDDILRIARKAGVDAALDQLLDRGPRIGGEPAAEPLVRHQPTDHLLDVALAHCTHLPARTGSPQTVPLPAGTGDTDPSHCIEVTCAAGSRTRHGRRPATKCR